MSLETWKEEFYQYDVYSEEAEKNPMLHSLNKWKGLLPNNLKKHKVAIIQENWDTMLLDEKGELFPVDAKTCALCQWSDGCDDCRLAKLRDDVPCDVMAYDEEESPWTAFKNRQDPRPMIQQLILTKGL
jgi:hypothetical protein